MEEIKTHRRQINRFAVKWLKKYKNPEIPEYQLEDHFAGECLSLGFKMDCGKTFKAAYGSAAFHDAAELRKIIDRVLDAHALGTAVFSKWRYSTHWACSGIDREWFTVALSRLADLTE